MNPWNFEGGSLVFPGCPFIFWVPKSSFPPNWTVAVARSRLSIYVHLVVVQGSLEVIGEGANNRTICPALPCCEHMMNFMWCYGNYMKLLYYYWNYHCNYGLESIETSITILCIYVFSPPKMDEKWDWRTDEVVLGFRYLLVFSDDNPQFGGWVESMNQQETFLQQAPCCAKALQCGRCLEGESS